MSYVFRCGCSPTRGIICGAHCQIQGCSRQDGQHTDACVRGERIEPTDLTWFAENEGEPWLARALATR